MKIVGIDTSSNAGSVSIIDDTDILGECVLNTGPRHSENIVASLDWLLNTTNVEKNDLQAVAVSVGPGSFTSLRVGVTIAKTLAYTLNLKIVGVSSLEILAMNIPGHEFQICPIIDAKRGELYTALYSRKNDILLQTRENRVEDVTELCTAINDKTLFIGDALNVYGDKLKELLGDNAVFTDDRFNIPRASNCALAGYFKLRDGNEDDPIGLVPEYLRTADVQQDTKKN